MAATSDTLTSELGACSPFTSGAVFAMEIRTPNSTGLSNVDRCIFNFCHLRRHPPSCDFSFTLETLDIYTLKKSASIPCSDKETLIQALIKSGYLGNTPITPTLAISLRTLELF